MFTCSSLHGLITIHNSIQFSVHQPTHQYKKKKCDAVVNKYIRCDCRNELYSDMLQGESQLSRVLVFFFKANSVFHIKTIDAIHKR
jgi:hypothetical protein